MELTRPVSLLSTLWAAVHAKEHSLCPETPRNPHTAQKWGNKHRCGQEQGHAGLRESRVVQIRPEARHTEIGVCTQSPIPPSHSPFPHQLQHKELVWTQLPLLPALGITLWVSHKAASPSSPSTQPTCCKQPGTNKQNPETFTSLHFTQLQ